MSIEMQSYKTSDLAFAAYLFCSGTHLSGIDRQIPQRAVFIFETPKSELISQWQSGSAKVNALAFYSAYQNLKAKIFRDEGNRIVNRNKGADL